MLTKYFIGAMAATNKFYSVPATTQFMSSVIKMCVNRCVHTSRRALESSIKASGKPMRNIRGLAPTEPYIETPRGVLMKKTGKETDTVEVPKEADIVVIGGGALGLSAAYWMKQRNPRGFTLTVVEKDPGYTHAATSLSLGGIRQQFSLKENIEMSLFSAEFYRNIKRHLSVLDLDPPDIEFTPQGYLILASREGAKVMEENHELQTSLGAKVELLNTTQLKQKFPWINTDGVALGSYGLQNEGYFDPWLYLAALKTKAASLGTKYVKGEVVGYTSENSQSMSLLTNEQITREALQYVHVRTDDGRVHPIKFCMLLNCGGPWSRNIGRLAGIGSGEGVLGVDIPVEPRKRYVYVFHCHDGPGLEFPMLIDGNGVYVRREGFAGHYVCGACLPKDAAEPSTSSLDVDYEFFENYVWPSLAHRVPAFHSLKEHESDDDPTEYFNEVVCPVISRRVPCFQRAELKSAWAGYYDYNYYDQNLILGNHPYHRNFYMATGCSGHGIQHSPAIGRALMECMTDDGFKTIDLSRMCFDRVLNNSPLFESLIV